MHLSDKKLAANRANAAKSRGPKTAEGKRISSRNATRHGILANHVLIEGESRENFAALLNSLIGEHKPDTPTGHMLIEKMAIAQWRQLRIWAIDAAGITHEMHRQTGSMTDEDPPTRTMLAIKSIAESGRHSELMSRYEHRYDRQYYRALEAYIRYQEHRQNAEKIAGAKRPQIRDENKGSSK